MAEPKRRGRPPGSKNKAREGGGVTGKLREAKDPRDLPGGKKASGSAENPKVRIGDNSNALTPEERRSLLISGVGEINKFTAEKDSVVAKIRNARARLKAYNFSRDEVDFAIKLSKAKDGDAAELDRWQRLHRIAQWYNHPIGYQVDMFGAEVDRTPANDRAFQAGLVAGSAGQDRSPPYDPSSSQYQEWLQGWDRGQGNLRNGIKKLDQPAESGAQKLTEPPANGAAELAKEPEPEVGGDGGAADGEADGDGSDDGESGAGEPSSNVVTGRFSDEDGPGFGDPPAATGSDDGDEDRVAIH